MTITKRAIEEALKALKFLARELPTKKGRVLTGLIGELSACQILELSWEPSDGHDATDSVGNRVQIKSRRDGSGGKIDPNGTVSGFTNFDFHYALYVELDANFEVDAIYKIEVKELISLIKRKDNALTVAAFRKYGKRVFQKSNP